MAVPARLIRPLVLAPLRGPVRAAAHWVLMALLVAAGVGAGHLHGRGVPEMTMDDAALQHRLGVTLASLQLAQARGSELERQVDRLQQRLQSTQEELIFLRQARDAARPGR